MNIYERLVDVTPKKDIADFDVDQLVKECNVAFQIIGYDPKNLENSVNEVFKSSHKPSELPDFIISVWLIDNAFAGDN